MSDQERRTRFQLIRRPQRALIEERQFNEPAAQGQLFPIPRQDLLIFLVFPRVTEDEFTKTLELAKPAAILELRRSPRFDIGHLNRQEAFKWFNAMHAKYYDLSSGISPADDVPADPVHLVDTFLAHSSGKVTGPIMLLISEASVAGQPPGESIPIRIARLFASASQHRWDTVEVPQFA